MVDVQPIPGIWRSNWSTYTCGAFPSGIPDEISWEEFDHRTPVPGDHGIQFEPAEAADRP